MHTPQQQQVTADLLVYLPANSRFGKKGVLRHLKSSSSFLIYTFLKESWKHSPNKGFLSFVALFSALPRTGQLSLMTGLGEQTAPSKHSFPAPVLQKMERPAAALLSCFRSFTHPVPYLHTKPLLQSCKKEAGNLSSHALSLQTPSFNPQMLPSTAEARAATNAMLQSETAPSVYRRAAQPQSRTWPGIAWTELSPSPFAASALLPFRQNCWRRQTRLQFSGVAGGVWIQSSKEERADHNSLPPCHWDKRVHFFFSPQNPAAKK